MWYAYGLDLAEVRDYFGIVVHRQEHDSLPQLQTLRKIQAYTYPEVERLLRQDLFQRFPPSIIVTDYTNERTFSEILIKHYGERKVEPVLFTQANKLRLKQEGLKILQMGYKFPARLADSQLQSWVLELIQQLKHEQMIVTPSGRPSFNHPTGAHNDLAIAWELSVHGCQKLMSRPKPSIRVGTMGSMAVR